MVIRFDCEYNGKNFNGFQSLGRMRNLESNQRTIQDELERAFSRYLGVDIIIHGSGRTDAGVHAMGQVCSFVLDESSKNIWNKKVNFSDIKSVYKFEAGVNSFLSEQIVIRDIEVAPDGFHARYSAKSKTYLYRIYVGKHRSPLGADFYWHVLPTLNIESMKQAGKILIGEHNFKSFCSQHSGKMDFVRTITCVEIETSKNDNEISFFISGNGFLRNMVRIIIGTLIDVGKGKVTLQQFTEILKSYDRGNAGITAPAHGLTLMSVEY